MTIRRRWARWGAKTLPGAAVVAATGLLMAACGAGAGPDSAGPSRPNGRSARPTAEPVIETPDVATVLGHRGPAVPDYVRPVTADKSQSKLWFQDRRWWALMYNNKTG